MGRRKDRLKNSSDIRRCDGYWSETRLSRPAYEIPRISYQALQPLRNQTDKVTPTNTTTVIFIKDVALCTEGILELIHQRSCQNADMTCAMDWTYIGPDPSFYDAWLARGISGDAFSIIPKTEIGIQPGTSFGTIPARANVNARESLFKSSRVGTVLQRLPQNHSLNQRSSFGLGMSTSAHKTTQHLARGDVASGIW